MRKSNGKPITIKRSKALIPKIKQSFMYIRNLKYAHLTPIFQLHNIHLYLCTEKVLNLSFHDFLCTKINNNLICFKKMKMNSYLKTNIQHEFLALNAHLSSFSKKSNTKIYNSYLFIPKMKQKRSRVITLHGAIKKSPILQ